jgi:hypothetical protein
MSHVRGLVVTVNDSLNSAADELELTPLGANYLIGARVGAGSTGTVHRGVRRSDGAAVAIKVLRAESGDDPEVVARFIRERGALTAVQHPHLIQIHDLVVESARAAIVMDWVGGGDLRSLLRSDGPMEPLEAFRVVDEILQALAAVHAVGVIHGDVKPANVLLDIVGVRLGDFGLSRLVTGSSLTGSSGLVGTVDYVAPELLPRQPLSTASDIYSTGCLLYELLTGKPPFAGETPAGVLLGHLEDAPPRPSELAEPVWSVVLGFLAKNPAERPSAQVARMQLAGVRQLADAPLIPWRTDPEREKAQVRGGGSRRRPLVPGFGLPTAFAIDELKAADLADAAGATTAKAWRSRGAVYQNPPGAPVARRRRLPYVLATASLAAGVIAAVVLVAVPSSSGTKPAASAGTAVSASHAPVASSAAPNAQTSAAKEPVGGASPASESSIGIVTPDTNGGGSVIVGGDPASGPTDGSVPASTGASQPATEAGPTGGGGSPTIGAKAFVPPSAPAAVAVASSTPSSATLVWSAPASGAVTGYEVARDGVDSTGTPAFSTQLPASARSFPFENLRPGDVYHLSVKALSLAGSGQVSSAPVQMPQPVMSAATSLQVSPNRAARSAVLSWGPPAAGSDVVTGYRVSRDGVDYSGTGAWSMDVSASTLSQPFNNLNWDTTYTFTVQPITSSGTGLAATIQVRL